MSDIMMLIVVELSVAFAFVEDAQVQKSVSCYHETNWIEAFPFFFIRFGEVSGFYILSIIPLPLHQTSVTCVKYESSRTLHYGCLLH